MNKQQEGVREAVSHFWATRLSQANRQGTTTGRRDYGARAAVTGGAQMDGFVDLITQILIRQDIPEESIHRKRRIELPGYFRPEKQWDLLVVLGGTLIATVELKSQVGPSFGNNYNNRSEEAMGNATDFQAAY